MPKNESHPPPRGEFEKLVGRHQAERHSKGFSSWGQFIAMLFCQLGQAKSLREIHEGLRASEGKLRHLGLQDAPSRSTLAYANQHRPHELFRDLFLQTYQRCQAQWELAGVLGQRIRLPHKLYSLDATVIDLCAGVRLGQVPGSEGGGEALPAAGPRRPSAQLRGDHAGDGA